MQQYLLKYVWTKSELETGSRNLLFPEISSLCLKKIKAGLTKNSSME